MSNALVALEAINAEIVRLFTVAELPAPQAHIISGVDVGVPGLSGDGDCSSLASGVVSAIAVDNFPSPAATGCGERLAYTLRIGIYRCIPVAEDFGGEEPSAEVIGESSAQILRDLEILYCGIRNALRKEKFDYRMNQYTPVGPQGGIGGGHWDVLIDSLREE